MRKIVLNFIDPWHHRPFLTFSWKNSVFNLQFSVTIKLVYPQGWIFDQDTIEINVDGETDVCSLNQDLTFTFTGFKYSGSILSQGGDVGPAGITVELVSSTGETFKTITDVDGKFTTATPILPGKYRLSALHESFSISEPVDIELTSDTNLVGLPVITGYQVTGRIEEAGNAVKGVTFKLKQEETVIGTVLSDETGKFTFDQVSAGVFRVVVNLIVYFYDCFRNLLSKYLNKCLGNKLYWFLDFKGRISDI
jgi:hypothetical protein